MEPEQENLLEISRENRSSMTFFCFTPLVSLGTFIIEIFFAIYILVTYRSTLFRQLCVSLLVLLGIFQLSEYLVCTTDQQDFWIKVGYVSITVLPALGIHITTIITKGHRQFRSIAYLCAGLLIAAILFIPSANLKAFCQPNYVEVSSNEVFAYFHTAYYVAFMALALYILWHSLIRRVGDSDEEKWMIVSYLIFIVPSIVLFYFKVIVDSALPSVMCGFALLTAVIFTIHIVPRYYKINKKKR